MEDLVNFLVLTGFLSPGESLIFKNVIISPLSKKSAKKILNNFGFEYEKVINELQRQELIELEDVIEANWNGIQKLILNIENKLRRIFYDISKVKNILEVKTQPNLKIRIKKHPFTPEMIFLAYKGNQPTKSESNFFSEHSPIDVIELIDRLAEVKLLKITEKKKSRSVTLSSDGMAFRFLYLNKSNLNILNYSYIEQFLLSPHGYSLGSFLKTLNSTEKESIVTDTPLIISILLIDLGVIRKHEEGLYSMITPKTLVPFNNNRVKELIDSVSGFIPIYVEKIREVIIELLKHNKISNLREELLIGPSTITGILKMLLKFNIAGKNEVEKTYSLTEEGYKLATLTDLDDFKNIFRNRIENYPIFLEIFKFFENYQVKESVGFLDISGFFRASGVTNFNPAKALSVLRLMTQSNMGIQEVRSGIYQLEE